MLLHLTFYGTCIVNIHLLLQIILHEFNRIGEDFSTLEQVYLMSTKLFQLLESVTCST